MANKTKKLILLLGMMLLAVQGWAQSDLERAETVQERFGFRHPVLGRMLTPEELLPVLYVQNGPTSSATLLNQGMILVSQLETRDQFRASRYIEAPSHLADLIYYGLGIPTTLEHLLDASIEEGMKLLLKHTSDELLGAFVGYKHFQRATNLTLTLARLFVSTWITEIQNVKMHQYLNTVQDPNDDEFEWLIIQVTLPIAMSPQETEQFHELCRAMWHQNQAFLYSLDASIESYRDDVELKTQGEASIRVSFSEHYAPADVELNSLASIGSLGTSIVSVEWFVNGQLASQSPVWTFRAWQPASYSIRLEATDAQDRLLIKTATIQVPAPSIGLVSLDRGEKRAGFSVPANPHVVRYHWDYGDGTSEEGSSLTSVTHTYPNYATYQVTLTLEATNGTIYSVNRNVSIDSQATYVSGTLYGNHTWDRGGSPYILSGQVTVAAGAKLTLRPGTVVQFRTWNGQQGRLQVDGEILSEGEFGTPGRVWFTSIADNSAPHIGGSDNGSSAPWGGISFGSQSRSNMAATWVRYGGLSGSPDRIAGSRVKSGSISFNPSRSLVFTGNSLYSSYMTVYGGDQDATLSGNVFDADSTFNLNSTFRRLVVTGNTRSDGSRLRIWLQNVNLSGANTWNMEPTQDMVVTGGSGSGLTIQPSGSLTLGSGAAVRFAETQYLFANGPLTFAGGSGGNAVLTSYLDNTPYGGTDGGGSWRGIQYPSGSTVNLSNFTIRRAQTGIEARTIHMTNCLVESCSTGVYENLGGGVYRNSIFRMNSLAVNNGGNIDIDARGNSWGHPTGPYHPQNNPGGQGNPVSSKVLFQGTPATIVITAMISEGEIEGAVTDKGSWLVSITLQVKGDSPAYDLRVNQVIVGATTPSSNLPTLLGNVAPGSSGTIRVSVPRSSLRLGQTVPVRVRGTHFGSEFDQVVLVKIR
ncbi:MAG TPA: PKD domain-containing protein [Fimbriimonadaceae bacterium]|nr:PKD domain-containing protein [Fimbriimonadaceae bacterium]